MTAVLMAVAIMSGSTTLLANEQQITKIEPVMKECKTILKVGSKQAILSDKPVEMPTAPTIVNGRTFLPLRFVTEEILMANVVWDNHTKKATVRNGEVIVEVGLNCYEATINGTKVPLDAPPLMINNSLLLPVRFMSEAFGMKVDYNSADKTITIISSRENKSPVAAFELDQEIYTEGQPIVIKDKSYDQDGDAINVTQWTLGDKSYNSLKELTLALDKLKPGTYEITLQVEDYFGAQSQKLTKLLRIDANQKPVITHFKPKKSSYAQGETIDFTYLYDNEQWEEITRTRWTYRQVDEPNNQSVITKPSAFFAKGEYIVTLQLTDAYGNVSEVKETTVVVTDEVKETEFHYKFTKGEIGDTIDNTIGRNYRDYKDVALDQKVTNQDTLIMSDSPEEVVQEGILYSSSFEGKGRLLLHHINRFTGGSDKNKMLVVVAENTYYQPVTITLSNKIVKGPAADVMYLGQQLLKDYLQGKGTETMTIAPGQKVYLYTSQDKNWLNGQCLSGLMDIAANGRLQITTAVMDKTDTIDRLSQLEEMERSIHVRGTFKGTVIDYKIKAGIQSPSKIVLGQSPEEWVNGIDELTGEEIKNKGNYGVTYRLQITAEEDTGIFLNPRADIFRGAIKWQDEGTFLAPSYGYFMNTNKKAVVLGVIKAGETRTLEYMLPNGSSAPVLIGFVPASKW